MRYGWKTLSYSHAKYGIFEEEIVVWHNHFWGFLEIDRGVWRISSFEVSLLVLDLVFTFEANLPAFSYFPIARSALLDLFIVSYTEPISQSIEPLSVNIPSISRHSQPNYLTLLVHLLSRDIQPNQLTLSAHLFSVSDLPICRIREYLPDCHWVFKPLTKAELNFDI